MNKLLLAALVPLPLASYGALAAIEFNGFGSVRATYANSDGPQAPFPYLKEGEVDFKGESLFALQARADLADGLTATVQLFAEGRDDFDIEARWAYLSYELNDQHQVNIGKLVNPIFHQSEYEKVGYAHNFSRLPAAVYSDFDFSTIEGVSLNSQFSVLDGEYTLETKLLYGNWSGEVFSPTVRADVPFGLDQVVSLNATLSGDWWKVFSGVFVAETDAEAFDQATILPIVQSGIDLATELGASANDIARFNRCCHLA